MDLQHRKKWQIVDLVRTIKNSTNVWNSVNNLQVNTVIIIKKSQVWEQETNTCASV